MQKTNRSNILRFLLFLVLVATVSTVYARAGGGSGGGGGHGFSGGFRSYGYHHHYYYGYGHNEVSAFATNVIMIITLSFTALFFFGFALLLIRSRKKARKKLAQAQQFDRFWDEAKMKAYVRDVFPKIQSAWMSRELKNVEELVTLRFIAAFQPLLNNYKRRKIVNVVDQVTIEKVDIVDIHDDEDNTKDRFAAYIKGHMRDYLAHESQGIAGTLADDGIEAFEDLYIFKRKEDRWVLDHIINEPETRDFKLKNHAF